MGHGKIVDVPRYGQNVVAVRAIIMLDTHRESSVVPTRFQSWLIRSCIINTSILHNQVWSCKSCALALPGSYEHVYNK